jgi:hypothetical protein
MESPTTFTFGSCSLAFQDRIVRADRVYLPLLQHEEAVRQVVTPFFAGGSSSAASARWYDTAHTRLPAAKCRSEPPAEDFGWLRSTPWRNRRASCALGDQ